jgi:glutamate carboxypeptidase
MITPDERNILDHVEREPILARTLDWAGVNSGTSNMNGVAEMAGRLGDAFAVLPGEIMLAEPAGVEKVGPDGKARPIETGRHFVLSVRPEAERRVLLTGHMDTVYAADHPFQTCDWLDADTLRGPGTADMKGGLSLMLAGLTAYEHGRPTLGYDVMINADEETGSLSSSALIAQLARGKLAALTYEPALPGGIMARARPGSGNFAAVVHGRSAHAGRNPEEGRNALVAAADLAQRLHAARRDGLTVNPARIEGGSPNNSVPDLAVLHFNMRPRGPEDLTAGQGIIDAAIADVALEHDVRITLHGGFARPPKPIALSTERLFQLVSQAASDLGDAITWKDTGGVCDGNNISSCGVPVIDTMGACGGAIHSPDEFLVVSSLEARAKLTALTLHRLDLHGVPA